MIPSLVLALVFGAAGALAGLPLFRSCVRSPVSAVYLIGGVWALSEAADLPVWSLIGLRVEVLDLVNLLVGAAALARLTKETRRRVLLIAATATAIYTLALVRGVLNTGMNGQLEFSDHLLILTGLLYGSTFVREEIEWALMLTAFRRLAGVLVAVLVLKQMGFIKNGATQTLSAASALIIAQALLAELLPSGRSSHRRGWTAVVWLCLLIGAVVVLQHRTVWVALMVALVAFALISARFFLVTGAGLIAALGLVAIMSIVGIQGSRQSYEGGTLLQELQVAADNRTTFDWRTERWRETLDTNAARGTAAVVFGAGYGASWVEFGQQADRKEPPHSQYVEIAVRFGIVGLTLWMSLHVLTLARLRRYIRNVLSDDPHVAVITFLYLVLITQMVWSISYSLTAIQPILLGLAVGSTARKRKYLDMRMGSPSAKV